MVMIGSCKPVFGAASAVVFVLFALNSFAFGQSQPTEAQILELLKQKRVVRCPTHLLTTGCNAAATVPSQTGPSETEVQILFAYGSVKIDRRARARLADLAEKLKRPEQAGRMFLIGGHTDARGSVEYNQRLSERRAEAVKRLLVEQFKLPPANLSVIGYGKTQLKNTADPFAGENRRVEIVNAEVKQQAWLHVPGGRAYQALPFPAEGLRCRFESNSATRLRL
jgi:outer membrane protein OmpA-like peptidoglycan-associated protein